MKKSVLKKVSFLVIIACVASIILTSGLNLTYAFTGTGTWSDPYSVSQAIANQNNTVKTVQGYVVGQPTSASVVVTSNYPNDYALALAETSTETSTSKMIYVQIPTAFRASYGLKSNPSLKGKVLKVTGTLTAYFSPHAGVKDATSMQVVTSTPTPSSTPTITPTPTSAPTPTPTTTSNPTDAYYSSAAGKTGAALKQALHDIIDNHTKLSYDTVWTALRQTDEDPNNTNNVILLYTGRSQGKYTNGSSVDQWNREHVWAKSHGDFGTTAGAGTDIHHLRPEDVSVNSARGNLDFDNGGTYHSEATQCRYDSDSWEPRDSVKGDVARMLFYMAVRYEGDVSGEPNLELSNNNYSGSTQPYHGKLSTLLQWHQQDPVDDFERRRNEIIYKNWQYNRNPFIDHPEWVSLIWN